MARTEFLRIGVVTSPHGVRGEVRVYPTTDEISRFSEVGTLLLEKEGVRSLRTVESVKRLKGMVALKLSGINSVEEAEMFRKIYYKQQEPFERMKCIVNRYQEIFYSNFAL